MDRSLTELLSEKSLFGRRLRERRLFLKLSQESLGVSIGLDESCSKTRISRYESGMHEPKLPTARLLANSLGVPLTYLYCEKDTIAELLLIIDSMSEEELKLITSIAKSTQQA